MGRRLLLTYLSLLACVLVALEVPLAVTFATRATQDMFIDRLNDAARFASLAEPAIASGETDALDQELDRYAELYGIDVAVVDRDRRVVAAAGTLGPAAMVAGDEARERIEESLSGERPPVNRVVWPWTTGPLVVSEPVGRSEMVGAVISSSPTGRLRRQIVQQWAVVWLGGLVALVVSWLLAVGMTRWILRPVRQLDGAARQITRGTLDARAAAASGPGELRHLAESFNQMADTVIGALEQQRQFVDHASHQLRNPLAALRLRIENLQAAAGPDGQDEGRLALEESERLAAILNGLLALARAERGHGQPAPCELGALVDARLAAARPLARRNGVTITRAGAARQEALAVPGMVEETVDELVGNACKFAGEGASVTVRLSERAGMAELHVVDDGPGLEEGELEQAVTRFWRSRAHQNVDGSGLGLAIVKVMAAASGGHLDLLPATPSGLDVRLRLPLPLAPARPAAEPSPPDAGDQPDGREAGGRQDTAHRLLSR